MRRPPIVLLVIPFLAACASPTRVTEGAPEGLRSIVAAFSQTVEVARRDQDVTWVHGWDGNDRIAAEGGGNLRGLCYEWQELVYRSVGPVAARVGWRASMIAVNEDWFSEHHAVMVHDRNLGDPHDVLARRSTEAWVLDPWIHGEAEVYRLQDWLAIPWIVFAPARIEPDEP